MFVQNKGLNRYDNYALLWLINAFAHSQSRSIVSEEEIDLLLEAYLALLVKLAEMYDLSPDIPFPDIKEDEIGSLRTLEFLKMYDRLFLFDNITDNLVTHAALIQYSEEVINYKLQKAEGTKRLSETRY